MGAGMYHIRVVGELDSTRIRAELDRISKSYRMMVGGGGVGGGATGKGKAGGGIVQLGKDAEQTKKKLQGLNGQVVRNKKTLKGFHTGFSNTGKDVEKSTGKLKAFGTETLHVSKKVLQFGAVTAVIRGVTSGMGDMVQKTFELDAALTEYKKVSDLTGKSLDKYTDQAFKAGRETAKTGTEMIEAATQFKKMGYTDQQSMTLAKTATMFQNIADAEISAGDSALFINSQLKAFNFSADQSMHVIDSVNEVANNFAVGTNDLQLALSKTASAMRGFGNSFEQTIGIITAGTEIMVGQPSKVARGWRTIGANITKLAKQTDVYKDASGKVEIQMRKSDGTMKNTYEFLTDLHKQWGNLNKEQQTAIALEMGGKNQMEVFMATMNNFDTAIEATSTAMNAQGSAANENSKYLESMQGYLQNLQSAWSEFANAMVKSSMLNKGMDILAEMLHFLSSDAGQAIIKIGLLTTGLNLFAKAALGLKGLSLVKLFSGLGGIFSGVAKGADEATDALKVMQGAQVGAAGGASKLAGAFMQVVGGLLAPVGLVAAIGLASVALAKYVDIGEKARDVKITKEFKNAQSDVEKTRQKYKSLNDELSALRKKEKEGTLTDSESNRLHILENQTKQLERQLKLKEKIAGNKADEYYHTVDPSKLKGRAKEKYTLAKSAGKSDKEALAAAGINDKIALSLNNVRAEADKVSAAQQKVTEAYERHGKESKQYKDALDDLDKAQDEQGDTLTKLEKKRKKAIEDYGSEKKANKALGDSWKDLNKEIKSLQALKGLNFEKPAENMKALKKNAKTLGLQFDKTGKKIKGIDLKTFTQKMTEAGYNTEDTWNYLKKIGEENPKLKIDVDGSKVAIEDLEFVDGQIQKIDKEDAEVDIEADDKASAKMDKIKKDKNLGKAEKKIEETGGTNVATTMGKLTQKKNLGKAKKNITQSGGDSVQRKLRNIEKKTNLGSAHKNISFSVSGLTAKLKKFLGLKKGIRHFASGGSFLDNAEVNEQGFEIIQDNRTGLMRVANGGKRGTTHLNDGDSVFTHGQSVRMLNSSGLTEGDVIFGHQESDFPLFGVQRLKGYKGGKLTQKQYNKKYKALTKAYDKDLETLEYNRDYYHWTDDEYAEQYTKLYEKYQKKLNALNKKKVKKGVKKKKTLGKQRKRTYNLEMSETEGENYKENIESLLDNILADNNGLMQMLDAIEEADAAQRITADEAAKYRKEAYKNNVEYNLKEFKNNKAHFADMRNLIEDYYAQGKIDGADYYAYLEDLAQEQLDKEKDRLNTQLELTNNTYDLARAYVERQISLLEKENEEQEEQNELVELQNNLAKARNQRIRIYKEGEGFVYEQDTDAIREATQALQDYQSESASADDAVNPVLKQWQDVLALFDNLEADYELKALENKVGATVGDLFGGMGTSTSAWSDWIKNNLSTSYGLQDVLDQLDELVDTQDILGYLDQNGQVTDAIIDAAIGNNVLPTTYAAAVTQAAQGINAIANTGTSTINQGAIAGLTSGAVVISGGTQYGNVYNFDNLVLPNVTNGSEFIDSLDNLPNTALQVSTQRG